MEEQNTQYGITGYTAPELSSDIEWIDGSGNPIEPIQLSHYKGKFKVIYGFQSWCPGCHSRGFPTLQKMVSALEQHDKVAFFVIQTVFEGFEANTKEQVGATQKKYQLHIPFGHDEGNQGSSNRSSTMYHYRSGGTPWFIFIDQNDRVVFNAFHLDVDKAIEYLKGVR